MEITIEWQAPIQLTRNQKIIVDADALPHKLQQRTGIYYFALKFGKKHVPFYVGESINIRKRLEQHLRSKKIADVLRANGDALGDIKNGTRYFHYGYLKPKQGQKAKNCAMIVQRHMIRQAVANGISMLNKKLTTYSTHRIVFDGSRDSFSSYERRVEVEA